MTADGNNFNDVPENWLTKFRAVYTVIVEVNIFGLYVCLSVLFFV